MKIVKDNISIAELKEMANRFKDRLVKAIVDVEKGIMAVDAGLHSDLFELLEKEEQSEPQNLWGINIFPDKEGEDFIQFDSMMNVRPSWGNPTRGVESKELQDKIITIVKQLVKS